MGVDVNQDIVGALSKITKAYDKNVEAFNSNEFVKASALMLLYERVPSYRQAFKR